MATNAAWGDAMRLLGWLREDRFRLTALERARELGLTDWCLAAGFVRNRVWDWLHGPAFSTPLNDLDLVYFDPERSHAERDRILTARLRAETGLPWSVKNQARMHRRHGHLPYASLAEALLRWVECETAVGVRLEGDDRLTLIAPLGIDSLLAGRVSHNPRHGDPAVFRRRVAQKGWRQRWPRLVIEDGRAGDAGSFGGGATETR
ncbi:nucleotidyltransferase family protein [Salinicola avicenniae]|uniref:nucleotidyltransferase family protein n=1 Tax=Salinicola avicenniae TaxID=2916836 RepID=UPI002074813F|nr:MULTISPECIES: nucleotidyltransferase family protein [unclassified Salinicola]